MKVNQVCELKILLQFFSVGDIIIQSHDNIEDYCKYFYSFRIFRKTASTSCFFNIMG